MKSKIKINPSFVNKAEIARKTGYTRQYISLLLSGKRNNKEALDKIRATIKEQLRAA